MTTITFLEYTSYILVLVLAMWRSHKVGEKSGSIYMLSYLRDHKYKNSAGVETPFLDDTSYNRFMAHMRKEKKELDNV